MTRILEVNPSRVLQLIKNDVTSQYRKILLWSCVAMLIAFGFSLIAYSEDRVPLQNFIPFVLILFSGAIFTSVQYAELKNSSSRSFYLTIPCSALEKHLSKALLSGPIYLAFFAVIYNLYMPASASILGLIFKTDYVYRGWYLPPDGTSGPLNWPGGTTVTVYFLLLSYLRVHALTLLGATYFRGLVMAKMILSVAAFLASLVFVTEISGLIVCGDVPFSAAESCSQRLTRYLVSNHLADMAVVSGIVDWLLIAWLHFIAYTSLKEKQVS